MEKYKDAIIVFNGNSQKLVFPETFSELQRKITVLFGLNLFPDYKICYKDSDEDVITITDSNDYEIALNSIQENTKILILPKDFETNGLAEDFVIINHEKEPGYEFIYKTDIGINDVENENVANKKPMDDIKVETSKKPDKMSDVLNEEKRENEKEKVEDSVPADIYSCLYCKGSGLNRKRKPCKKCNGTGRMSQEMKSKVNNIVKLELGSIINSELSEQASVIVSSQFINSRTVHHKIACSHCGVNPIIGIRYCCPYCEVYNLCEKCEKVIDHEHALFKLKTESNILPKPIDPKSEEEFYEAKLIDQNPAGLITVKPGAEVTTNWFVRNSGKFTWPPNIMVEPIGEAAPNAVFEPVIQLIPNGTTFIRMKFTAPTSVGVYCFFYHLVDDKGREFGPNLTIEPKVEISTEDEQVAEYSEMFPNQPIDVIKNLVKLVQLFEMHEPEELLDKLIVHENNIEQAVEDIQ